MRGNQAMSAGSKIRSAPVDAGQLLARHARRQLNHMQTIGMQLQHRKVGVDA